MPSVSSANIVTDSGDIRPDLSGDTGFRFQEYWVDFLGGLLPGTLFLVGSLLSIIPAYILLLKSVEGDLAVGVGAQVAAFGSLMNNIHTLVWTVVLTAMLVISYVLGHIFYRQDPNRPNRRSFARLRRKELKTDNSRTACDLKKYLRGEYGCGSEDECEFPYEYFDQYLVQRGLDHLVPLVVWRHDRGERTKNFINVLKIRLKFHFPNRCATIIRNEAHVRLASSTWYVGTALCVVAVTSLCIAGGSILLLGATHSFRNVLSNESIMVLVVVAILMSVTTVLVGLSVRNFIERFLHYQRQREVVHVMETAYVAFRDDLGLLIPPFRAKDFEDYVGDPADEVSA